MASTIESEDRDARSFTQSHTNFSFLGLVPSRRIREFSMERKIEVQSLQYLSCLTH